MADNETTVNLAEKLEKMDDTEIKLYAQQQGIDVAKVTDRAGLVAAIEQKASEAAAAAVAAKKLQDDEAAQAASIAGEEDRRSATDKVIRALNADFCRDVPPAARSGGTFEPDEGDPRFGGDYDVPNGRYRVVGSDHLFDVKGKKLVAVHRASAVNKWGGAKVVAIG